MFRDWWEWRKASRAFNAFTKKWNRLARERKRAGNPIDFLADEEYGSELRQVLNRVRYAETIWLSMRAGRLGIDVFRELPLDARDRSGDLSWWEKADVKYAWPFHLKPFAAARLRWLIKEKQYELAKKWTDLLAPILSTVISILALLLAALALYLQAVSDNIIVIPPPR